MSDFDVIAVMGVMLGFGVVLLFGDLILSSFMSGNALCGALNNASPDVVCQGALTAGVGGVQTFSNLFIVIYFAAILGSIFLASLTPSSPMFFLITFITAIGVFITAPIIANLYFGMLNSGSFAAVEGNHGAEIWFFQNLPVLTILSHLLIGFVLHGKPQSGGGGGVPQAFR